jgi:hypothetical protein
VPDPARLPELLAIGDYRWRATCGTCGRQSAPAKATTAANAWRALVAIGWVSVEEDDRVTALCRTCARVPGQP